MELSNINSAPHPPSHISSITRAPLEWAIRLQSKRRILCCWSCLCRYPKPSFSASHLAWRPAETRPLSSCPTFWGSGAVASSGCGEYPRHTQLDRHAERCSSMHCRKQTQPTSIQADTRDHTDAHTAFPSATWM
jgi:hypothetical protein